ncbi:MAG: glycerol kinase GlpK [Traorella sp.]
MSQYICAIDQGTTSTRAILFDKQSNIIATAQKECENYYPKPGWVEQNANSIYASVIGVIHEVVALSNTKMSDIAAIGITNQRETTIVWDKKTGNPVSFAIVWQSRQSDSYCQEMKQKGYEDFFYQKCGLVLDPYFSASKIRYILDHLENGQERAEKGELLFGTVESFIIWKLTNGKVHVSDVSNASRTLLMSLDTLNWDDECCRLWNIPKCMLPKIVDNSCVYGFTEKSILGAEIPIASAVGDQQAALFGQTCFEKGSVKNTYGTGCFLLMNTGNEIIHSKNGLLSCVGWKIKDEVNYVLEGSVFVAGAAIQWLRDGLKIIRKSSETDQRAREVTSCDGVMVVPSFTGLGAPYWKPQVKGAIFGLTRGTTQEHLIRATLESLAYQTNDVLKAMCEDSNMKIEFMQVDGGASQNDFLMQFQSDISHTIVKRSVVSETTALGAAYLAGLAVGYWKDKEEIRANYQVGSVFEPKMNEENRKVRLDKWEKAIQSVIYFE